MTRELSTIQVVAGLQAVLKNTLADGSSQASVSQGTIVGPTLTDGTSVGEANRVWSSSGRTLTSGNSEMLDLYDLAGQDIGAGAGRDAVGQLWTIAELVGLFVHVKADSTGTLMIGGGGVAGTFTSLTAGDGNASLGPLGPGGVLLMMRPDDPAFPVVDGSNHLLQFAANGGDCTYDVVLIGRSN